MPSSKKNRSHVDHVKRPINSFMLWTKTYRPILFKQNPNVNNSVISILLGQKWNALSYKEKKIYKDKAEQVKLEHKEQNPDYIFRPTKKIKNIKNNTNTIKKNTNNKKIKNQSYIPLIINANKQIKSLQTRTHAKNDSLVPIYFTDNWLNYKEYYNYYEDIELFYSKL